MFATMDDCFVVYAREESLAGDGDLPVETEMVRCASYEEARWVCQRYSTPGRKYVIRYLGPAGGGD
jgi:hypothetical protein